jgi:hypothetical protein
MAPAAKAHVIYRITEPSDRDLKRLATATTVAADGLDVSFSSDRRVAVLRSGVAPEDGGRLTAALVVGASRAAHNQWVGLPEVGRPEYELAMRRTVTELISVFPAKPFYPAFTTLLGGSQWTFDRNEVAEALCRATAEVDYDTIARNLTGDRTGGRLVTLARHLGVELSSDETRAWRGETGEQVLARRPELDYRQLHNPRFARSDRGKMFAAVYAQFCAEIAAKGFKRGAATQSPPLPVSRYPVLAGFLEDTIRTRVPTPHSSAAEDVVKLVLASDSIDSQVALFEIICAPAPQGPSYPFPGPSEFEVRRRLVHDVWNAYLAAGDENHRTLLKIGLQGILEAYTSGELAQDLVRQGAKLGAAHGLSGRSPLSQARQIVGGLTRAFVEHGDHDMASAAMRAARSPQTLIRPPTRPGSFVGLS